MVEQPNKPLSIISYLFPIIGPIITLIAARRNLFALYHACQAIALTLFALMLPVGWVVISWAIAWIPMAGPTIGASIFTLVVVGLVTAVILSVSGIVNAARGNSSPLFLIGQWGDRLYIRLYPQPVVKSST